MSESLWLNGGGEVAAQLATAGLTQRGLQVVRSFDLSTARSAHADCACPHQGTAKCTCQYVVLLVYAARGAPAVLTFHSRDSEARVQIVRDAYIQPEASLVEQIMAALLETALALQAAREPEPQVAAKPGQEVVTVQTPLL